MVGRKEESRLSIGREREEHPGHVEVATLETGVRLGPSVVSLSGTRWRSKDNSTVAPVTSPSPRARGRKRGSTSTCNCECLTEVAGQISRDEPLHSQCIKGVLSLLHGGCELVV